MSDFENYERRLSAWRDAQAVVDLLREFERNGGSHRMRMTAEDNFIQAGAALHNLLRGEGYRAMLATSIRKAEHDAHKAKMALLDIAVAEKIEAGIAEAVQ